jgi:putative aldouronate transport system substrate-binding protein
MITLTLVSCSGDGNDATTGQPATSTDGNANSDNTANEENEVTLKFYFGGEKPAATDEVWAKVSDYVKAKGLNVKFNINFIPWNDLSGRLLIMAASGDKWDMNFDSDTSFNQMAANGSYLPLNELLPTYAPHMNDKYKELGTLASATVNGQIVGLPWTMKMNQRTYAGWREDLAEKAGIFREPDSVKTIEDVDKLLYELKAAYPDAKLTRTAPLSLFLVRDEWVDLAFHGLGFYMNDPKHTVRAIEQQPFYIEAGELAKKWYDDKILNRDAMIDKEDGAELWRNGKTLFTLTSHEWAYANPGFSDPSFSQQMSLIYPNKRYINRSQTANVLAINRNSEHADLVLRFLDMLETDRVLYDLVLYGIEGKTYVLNGETVEYPGDMQYMTSNYMEWGGQWVFWKPQFMRPTQTYTKNFWLEEAKLASLPVNVDSPVEGLFITGDNIKSEVAKRDDTYEGYGKRIEYGNVDNVKQAVSDYIDRQKENGIDKVIAEVQRQVDQYLAKKGRMR